MGALWLFERLRHEDGRWLYTLARRQNSPHRHTFPVAPQRGIGCREILLAEIPATKEAHTDTRARGGIDFAPAHRIKQCLAGVLGCPHRGIAGGEQSRAAHFGLGYPPQAAGALG